MLTYSFDNLDGETLYEHLYGCLKRDIIEGRLSANFQLPSKRSFAKHLNISTITIENAYDQLVSEGFIYSVPRKGFFVSDLEGMTSYIYSAKKKGKSSADKKEISKSKELFADFTSNQTEASSFPFSTWAKITRNVLSNRQNDLMVNPSVGGVIELREAIAEYLSEFRDINVLPEQIIIGAGTEYLYTLIFQLVGRDKRFAVENPGYEKLTKILEAYSMEVSQISLDDEGLSVVELEKSKSQVVHVTPSHHFPTGITMPVKRRYELLSWAAHKEDRYIIEDDYDSEFRMNGRPVPSLFSMDIHEKIIYMNTFTKSLASTIRISYMVLPIHLVKIFSEKLDFYANTVSTFEQYTLAAFIKDGHLEKHINRQRTAYRRKRNLILSKLQKGKKLKYIHIAEEDAGLHFLLTISTKKTEGEFLKAAEKKGIGLRIYNKVREGVSSRNVLTLVINYSSIPEEKIEEAVRRLEECI